MKKIIISIISMSALMLAESDGMQMRQRGSQHGNGAIFQPEKESPKIRKGKIANIDNLVDSKKHKLRGGISKKTVVEYLTANWVKFAQPQREHAVNAILISSNIGAKDYAQNSDFTILLKKLKLNNAQTIISLNKRGKK